MYVVNSNHTPAQAAAIETLNSALVARAQVAYDYGVSYIKSSREHASFLVARENALALRAIAF